MSCSCKKKISTCSLNEYQKFLEDNFPQKVHEMLIQNVKSFSKNILSKLEESEYWKNKYLELENYYNLQSDELIRAISSSSVKLIVNSLFIYYFF